MGATQLVSAEEKYLCVSEYKTTLEKGRVFSENPKGWAAQSSDPKQKYIVRFAKESEANSITKAGRYSVFRFSSNQAIAAFSCDEQRSSDADKEKYGMHSHFIRCRGPGMNFKLSNLFGDSVPTYILHDGSYINGKYETVFSGPSVEVGICNRFE